MTLGRVLAVLFNIHQVIDEIDGAGNEAKKDKGSHRLGQQLWNEKLLIEDQGGEDEDVLGPLFGAHGFQQACKHSRCLL